MNRGIIKRVGNQTVDVQLAGSATTLPGVLLSGQIDRNALVVGAAVLVDWVDERSVVLHTLAGEQQASLAEQSFAGANSTTTNNALLADGSVPLMGDLAVAPGVTIDGYDISVLGQTIDNLQAADSVARTGHTVLTHASHLVATIGPDDGEVLIRHNIFSDKETLVVSNTMGEVEFMRVVGDPVAAVDNNGALCWRYTVTRRVATNPTGIVTGWAAATLVNGLTHKGYISVDARETSVAAPNLRFVMHTDIDAGSTEQIVRIGNVRGILGNGDDDFGFAVGRLNTGDRYFSYNYGRNLLALRGADFSMIDESGAEAFRVWGVPENDHNVGDTRLGKASGGHIETGGNEVNFFAGSQPIMTISPTGSRFRGMIWSGTQPGPQVGIGEESGQGLIVARNAAGVGQFVVRTDDENVHVHMGNPVIMGGYAQFTNGEFTTDGIVRARAFELLGGGNIGSGVVLTNAGKFTAGTGNNVAVIDGEDAAWRIYAGHATPASAPFRVNQAGEAWLTNAHVTGEINANSGVFGGWTLNSTYLAKDTGVNNTSAGLAPNDYPVYAGATYANRATAPFRVTPAGALTASNADITGTVNATAGNFTGSVYVGAANPRIHVDGANKLIESTNFASGTSGFRIEGTTGNAEFNNVTLRGTISAAAIQYGYVLATNGSIWVTPSVGRTLAVVTSVNSPSTFNVDIKDPDGMTHAAAGTLWAVGDYIRIREPLVGDLWARVTTKTDMTTYWRLAVVKESPGVGVNYSFTAGAAVLNYKTSGAGSIRLTADEINSPYISIATHAGNPWTAMTERVRLGNLAGISGASGYGLWTDNGFFTGTITATAGSIGGWTIASGHLYAGIGSNRAGLQPATYPFYAGSDTPAAAPFRVTPAGALVASNATIAGSITATSGVIGGWTLSANSLAGGNAILHSSGYINFGTSNDIARLDAVDVTYRLWVGDAIAASAPFRVTKAGVLTASSATITGSITASSFVLAGGGVINPGGTLTNAGKFTAGTGNNVAVIDGENATWRVYAGHATPTSAPFRVSQAGEAWLTNAHVTGEINATTGNFTGSVYVGAANPRIHIDGVNKRIESTNFASGTSGFRIAGTDGSAEFNNVTVRGAIRASLIQYGYVQATNGSVWVTKSAGKTLTSFVAPAPGNTAFLDIENPEGMTHIAAGGLWAVNDVVFLQEPLSGGFWGKITAKTNMTTYWRLTVQNATLVGTAVWQAGTFFLHFSEAGAGKPIAEMYSTFYGTTPGNTTFLYVTDPVGMTHAQAGALWDINDTIYIQDSVAGEYWGRVTAKVDQTTHWRMTIMNIAPAINPGTPVPHYSSTGDAKATGKTLTVFTVPTVGSTGPLDIEDPAGMTHANAGALWAVNDQVRLSKPLSVDVIGTVTAKTDKTTYWQLTVQNISSTVSGTFLPGATVLNYGQTGQGIIRITADANDNPYISIATHAGSPWSGTTERVRLGNLAGISGATGYGLWTNNGYFTGTVHANAGSIAGWTITSGHLYSGWGSNQAGLQPSTYPFYAGSDTPAAAPFRVTPAGALTATSGAVGGWTLATTKLYWEDPVNFQGIGMATYNDASGYAFWAGDHRPDFAEFRVSNNGAMWATSGNIAGWTIASGHLFSGSGTNRAGLQPALYPFYAGSDTPAAAPFRVTQSGALTATNVSITAGGGNATLDSNGLRLAYAATSTAYISWYSSSTLKAYLGSFLDQSTNVLRANVQSSGRFEVTGAAEVNLSGTTQVANLRTNGGLAFFSTSGSGTSKQTVTGSRGGNAALASLLTALAAYGLITDSTTA